MLQSQFHAYYAARMLSCATEEDVLASVFASSSIQVYPFQIAAASFALRSPYQKGAILCDEAGMGKSHEAMLIMNQRWMEGRNRILLCIPNADLLVQWTDLLERYYSVPYVTMTSRIDWADHADDEHLNGFEQEGIVITTYDFATEHEAEALAISWDLVVFEEANALSGVYREDNRQARALWRIAGNAFKLLLTGTPIEKNIMDLYGLLWFIDPKILPDEQTFLARYLRKPENYPELAEHVGKHCFRTLRAQAKGYAKVPERVLLTYEYTPSQEERRVYDLLYAYVTKANKLAFPEMDSYDLALRLIGLQSSSTAAIKQTITGIIARLGRMENADEEIAQLQEILAACEAVIVDAKAMALLDVLRKGFALLKKSGAKKKAVVFTESIETQKMLYPLVSGLYQTVLYNGSADYTAIRAFKDDAEVLITTDNGAKGFNLEEASFVIHYDLLYNTLKMEQRIDRCHRMGQQNDVLSVAFIDKENFTDVRKLELVNKRMLVSDGVFGVSDEVIGGFTGDLEGAFSVLAQQARSRAQVEEDHRRMLTEREAENRQIVATAEDMLFTTFTRKLAQKVKLAPRYVEARAAEMNDALWAVAKWFFLRYNEEHDDCVYVIDETARTITATAYKELPTLFYYWDGRRNKRCQSQKVYGMAPDFKPRHGRITLSSIVGRGILNELECANEGTMLVQSDTPACSVGLYHVELNAGDRRVSEQAVLIGQTDDGKLLSQEECCALLVLPVVSVEHTGRMTPHWLKGSGAQEALDALVPVDEIIAAQQKKLSPAQEEVIEAYRLETKAKKAALTHEIDDLAEKIRKAEVERDAMTTDRLGILAINRQINQLRRTFMKKQESQFFDAMRLDMELEEQIKKFTEDERLSVTVVREFIVRLRNTDG